MGCSASTSIELNLDVENATPTQAEQSLFQQAAAIIGEAKVILARVEDYKGCRELARTAMSTPTKENEQAAFEGLLDAVEAISSFFEYSKALENIFPPLLKQICGPPQNPVLGQMQAVTKQVLQIIDFALVFDQTRMLRPNLSNDFSYYRRLLSKFHKHPRIKVKDDEASGMALFTAEHIPMTSTLTRAAIRSAEHNEFISFTFSVIANSCMRMLKNKKYSNPATNLLLARAMAGSVVLFDHVDVIGGAFGKRSGIALREIILILKRDFSQEQALLNAVHYSTKTFKNAPANVQELFD